MPLIQKKSHEAIKRPCSLVPPLRISVCRPFWKPSCPLHQRHTVTKLWLVMKSVLMNQKCLGLCSRSKQIWTLPIVTGSPLSVFVQEPLNEAWTWHLSVLAKKWNSAMWHNLWQIPEKILKKQSLEISLVSMTREIIKLAIRSMKEN